MPNYPNMQPEIIEAVHGYFEDHPEVEVDCLLYLGSLRDNWSRVAQLANEAEDKLEDMDRCSKCGEPLLHYTYDEVHDELDEKVVEHLMDVYCPNCDIGGEDYQ